MTDEISIDEARALAIAAQGFGVRSRRVDRMLDRLGVLQLDSVNVVCRAHYMPLFSRLGAYDRDALDARAWSKRSRPRALFEYWGHQASLLPVTSHRLFRWRMERTIRGDAIWGSLSRFGRERRAYIAKVLDEIRERGPLAASELTQEKRGAGGWWGWSDAKRAAEWLFCAGRVTTASRWRFERLYDLPERVLPADVLAAKTPDEATAHRELLTIAARALGVATEDDLADYFRVARREARPRIAELVEGGELTPVRVAGWTRAAFRVTGMNRVARFDGGALLAPFDPLIWHRARAERLFDFHYRIGIYTPSHARTHGYYVLPFLLEDRLVARVDLKADRASRALLVQSAHVEAHAKPRAVVEQLATNLRALAEWLDLERVVVARRGDLAAALRGAFAKAR